MSDQHQLRSSPVCQGEIEHTHQLSENIGALFENDDFSDLILIVEGKNFNAHRIVLAARSEYFRALLYGGMKESDPGCSSIELKGVSSAAFRHLLRYVYTAKLNLTDVKEDVLLDVFGLAHQYNFSELELAISEYLESILSSKNVCFIYDIAKLYSQILLLKTCSTFMDRNASEILQSESFLHLSEGALHELIARDSFCAPEIEIFTAVCSWKERNVDADVAQIIRAIRLPLMNITELLNVVRPTGLVCPDAILDAIKLRSECRDMELKYRGFLVSDENVATLRRGASLEYGELKSALLDGDTQNYDLDHGFSRHPIDEHNCKGLVIRLGSSYIINMIRLLLWDRDMRSYSYYIDVSMDQKDWIRVIDHQDYLCRSWQTLYFRPVVAKYVKVVGTHNTVNRVFHAVALECYYTNKPFVLDNGLTVPSENVATIEGSAHVIEGVSRSRNALINGESKNYDWDSGYTCHQLGSGAIVIQLPQPYVIGSMRILLWDCDDRHYSYVVDVSIDQIKWHTVADKSKELCKSWQLITFLRQPVIFIRIVGTQNTANEVFHCVHYECPASISS